MSYKGSVIHGHSGLLLDEPIISNTHAISFSQVPILELEDLVLLL